MKKSPRGFLSSPARKSTSQIGLQAARAFPLRVRRPLKTSRQRRSATFSTVSGDDRTLARGIERPSLAACCPMRFGSSCCARVQAARQCGPECVPSTLGPCTPFASDRHSGCPVYLQSAVTENLSFSPSAHIGAPSRNWIFSLDRRRERQFQMSLIVRHRRSQRRTTHHLPAEGTSPRSTARPSARHDLRKRRYCEPGALDDLSVGICGSGTAAASVVPLPVAPVCPRRLRCEPRTAPYPAPAIRRA
ncbi:hypothetical protein B0G69_0097 [Paraburkholderia sp. RAU2J]|nr:hypothetical protein B0G69_0097 [Paraburkholderia sp. RAU2J]